jgi:hypothetical protein
MRSVAVSKKRIFLITVCLLGLFVVGGGMFWARNASSTSLASVPTVAAPGSGAPISGPILPDVPCTNASTEAATGATGTPDPNAPTKVDVLFLLDSTGSMGGSIEGVKNSIKAFVAEFQQREIDVRVGLIAFRDRTDGEEPQMLMFNDQVFTTDPNCFSSAVSKLAAMSLRATWIRWCWVPSSPSARKRIAK